MRSTAARVSASSVAVGGDQREQAVVSVLGLGQQVERDAARGRRPASATTTSSLGPAMPSMPTAPATWRLASCT